MSEIPPTSIACTADDMGLTERGQLNLALSENAYNAGLISELSQVIEAANEMERAILSEFDLARMMAAPRIEKALREYQRLRDLYWR